MPKKINYSEGDIFSVPLREGGYARGLVARVDNKGVIFGYFFGPKVDSDNFDQQLNIEHVILLGMFGDLGLLNQEWKLLGKISDWSREDWVMPPMLRFEEGESVGFLSYYDEDSLECISEKKINLTDVDIDNYPKDSVMGYGFVEIKLTKILS